MTCQATAFWRVRWMGAFCEGLARELTPLYLALPPPPWRRCRRRTGKGGPYQGEGGRSHTESIELIMCWLLMQDGGVSVAALERRLLQSAWRQQQMQPPELLLRMDEQQLMM